MYSLQEQFDLDTPGTLDWLKAQGFTDIETSVFTKLPAAGLRFAYHNHSGEFREAASPAFPGETFYDVLASPPPRRPRA